VGGLVGDGEGDGAGLAIAGASTCNAIAANTATRAIVAIARRMRMRLMEAPWPVERLNHLLVLRAPKPTDLHCDCSRSLP
jgi:hypothetical protein